jgi:hypothetical protein
MQTLIYALRVQTTEANARALLEYFDRHSGARALLRETEWEEIGDLITRGVRVGRNDSRNGRHSGARRHPSLVFKPAPGAGEAESP